MSEHKVIFHPMNRPLSADEAARVCGMTARELARAILENKDGKYDRLYVQTEQAKARGCQS